LLQIFCCSAALIAICKLIATNILLLCSFSSGSTAIIFVGRLISTEKFALQGHVIIAHGSALGKCCIVVFIGLKVKFNNPHQGE
jgi:membrane protein DedA with SNARE-associated domain